MDIDSKRLSEIFLLIITEVRPSGRINRTLLGNIEVERERERGVRGPVWPPPWWYFSDCWGVQAGGRTGCMISGYHSNCPVACTVHSPHSDSPPRYQHQPNVAPQVPQTHRDYSRVWKIIKIVKHSSLGSLEESLWLECVDLFTIQVPS